MSLIEAALERAKKLTDTQRIPTLDPAVVPVRNREPQPSAEEIQAAMATARSVPTARVDAGTMERNGVLLQVSDVSAQRAYRILRTRVQQRMQAQGWWSVAVTAAGAAEGKTLTAVNLAISLAKDVSTSVFLVDLDLQRPRVAATLGMEFRKGLADYLEEKAEIEQILYSPGIERLTVIPNSRSIENSSDQLGSARMLELRRFLDAELPRPIVIFDMPPLLLSDDVLRFAPNVDCTLFVAAEGATSRAVLQNSKEVLKDLNLLGVVLNRSSEREESGYY